MHLPIHQENQGLSHVNPKSGRKSPCWGLKKISKFFGKPNQLFGIKRSNLCQKHCPVTEVLSNRGVARYSAYSGEAHRRLLLKKLHRRFELVVNQLELRVVSFRVYLHFRLQRRKAQLFRPHTRCRYRLRHHWYRRWPRRWHHSKSGNGEEEDIISMIIKPL